MKKRGVSLVGLIFVIILFCFTLFVFLDLFEIVDVPDKYSIISRISKKISPDTFEETDTSEEEYINELEEEENDKKRSNANSSRTQKKEH